MGLYLCIFDGNKDVAGVDVGPYADYNALRDYITGELEAGKPGSKFPTFVLHSDCDGEWSVVQCEMLNCELSAIATALKQQPAIMFVSDWQKLVAKSVGINPQNAFESFIDADGEFLLERLQSLVASALERRLPIQFQ